MSTTLIKRMSCGCEFLEQLDTHGTTSLRVDVCEQEHQTRLESTRDVLNKVAQLEEENEALRLDRNLYDKGWDKTLEKLRTYRELLSEVGDYFKHLGMDGPSRLASKVFDALLKGEDDE